MYRQVLWEGSQERDFMTMHLVSENTTKDTGKLGTKSIDDEMVNL
jgi:hypothetical protein